MSDAKELTLQEVSAHNTKKDLYMVIHDKVYDVSSFVDEHPYVIEPLPPSPRSTQHPEHPKQTESSARAKKLMLTQPECSGGEEVLLDVAGQDGTEAFEDVGHSDEAREILDGLLVGNVKRMVRRKQTRFPTLTPLAFGSPKSRSH